MTTEQAPTEEQIRAKIKTRGFWEIKIHPGSFKPDRISRIQDLFPIVSGNAVEIRGWDFPHIDTTQRHHIDVDWVGQASEWNHALEAWRMYRSGLYTALRGFPEDWRDQSEVWPRDRDWAAGEQLGIGEVIYAYSEIFLFASRLGDSAVGSEQMAIDIAAAGLRGRRLVVDDPRRWPIHTVYEASLDRFPHHVELSSSQLRARVWDYALEAAAELFARFGWDPGDKILKSWQEDIREFGTPSP
jgi:hypothetical protein